MCLLEPPTPVTATPNLLTAESDHQDHFESLLATATIVCAMGNINVALPPSTSSNSSESSGCKQAATRAIRQVCPLSTFILGGPMPPSPGLIPLCWEDLVDWTQDATLITEQVYQRSEDQDGIPPCGASLTRDILFVPYVSIHEPDDVLKKLASQSYMERAQFYQESVVIAVKQKGSEGVLCLITLFQFCRYFTLIRRLADSQTLVFEYQATAGPLTSRNRQSDGDAIFSDGHSEHDSLLIFPTQHSSEPPESRLQDCAICLDKTEDCVLHCCSQAICADCHKRWVRRRLRCPFCRQPFKSVKEAVQTQWQLSAAIPVEHVIQDVESLRSKISTFWDGLDVDRRNGTERLALSEMLNENYVQRPKTIQSDGSEDDGFVVIHA